MQKIRHWSLVVQCLLASVLIIEAGSYLLVVISEAEPSVERGEFVMLLGELRLSMLVSFSGAWQSLSEGLIQNGLKPLYWLSSTEVIFSVCLYTMLFRLFALFRAGQVFTLSSISALKRLGQLCFFWCGWMLFYPALLSIGLKSSGLAALSSFSITFGTKELGFLLVGTLLYASATIMAEALNLYKEHELVI